MSCLPLSSLTFFLLVSSVAVTWANDRFDSVNLRRAKGIAIALYNEGSGTRYAKIHYEEFSKRPARIGFLKVGLPILTFHELSLHLDAKQANARSILSVIEQTVNSRSARYLFGENVSLTITNGDNEPIKLRSRKVNFHRTGLRFSDSVEILLPGQEKPFYCETIFLKTKQETNSLALVNPKGKETASIQLGVESKPVAETQREPDSPQTK